MVKLPKVFFRCQYIFLKYGRFTGRSQLLSIMTIHILLGQSVSRFAFDGDIAFYLLCRFARANKNGLLFALCLEIQAREQIHLLESGRHSSQKQSPWVALGSDHGKCL